MSLISLIITIVVVGLLLWVVNSFIPMESRVKSILNVVVIIVLVLWLLRGFGVLGSGDLHVSLDPSSLSTQAAPLSVTDFG